MAISRKNHRFSSVSGVKAGGVTYTPTKLADFVAAKIVGAAQHSGLRGPLRILDPAVGEGELLVSLMSKLQENFEGRVEIHGFDTDSVVLSGAENRIRQAFPNNDFIFTHGDFLEVIAASRSRVGQLGFFDAPPPPQFDLIIANPPYIRTQIMGALQAQEIAQRFGLNGRVDIYHAFIRGLSVVLKDEGVAGIIVSNRFMSTRSGESVRRSILNDFSLIHAWDFGDTKLFDAAVLPSVLLLRKGKHRDSHSPRFTSIYETTQLADLKAGCPVEAVELEGVVEVNDRRKFLIVQGTLSESNNAGAVWRVATQDSDDWLNRVEANTWGKFRDIGKIRVGVKTCADKVFIGDDWLGKVPELLRPLTTHHIGRRFKALSAKRPRFIIYPHEVADGVRRAVNLDKFPITKEHLERHRSTLEGRSYVLQAGRQWYEIWVPQDPAAWVKPKLVFRDISEEPIFWVDLDGTVVNGDCYWLLDEKNSEDSNLLWLAAAVANSKFIENYYDHRFNNKLYAGRRRFITQYVEEFPLPNPKSEIGRDIIARAKNIYRLIGTPEAESEAKSLEHLVWTAFGLGFEEV